MKSIIFCAAFSGVLVSSPEEFSAFLKEEIAKWGKVVRGANISAE